MLLHPDPRRVFIGGGGELATAREVLKHSGVELCTMVELDEIVVEISKRELTQWSEGVCDDPRIELVIGDALEFLERDERSYDVIIMDISDPVEAGPGVVFYTQEFYKFLMNSGRLSKDGVFVTQSGPGSFINLEECGSTIHRTLRSIFRHVVPYSADIPSFGSSWGFNIAYGGPAAPDYARDIRSKVDADVRAMVCRSPEAIDAAIAQRIEGALRHYDGIAHVGMFGITKGSREVLVNEQRIMTRDDPVFMF
jgi:spermidine synthase